MSEYEEESEGQIATMVPQLGTKPSIMALGEWDTRLLSYIVNPEKMPSSLKPVLYALTRRDVVTHKKRFWDALTDNYLVLVNSIDGRGQNNIIRGENAMKGIPVQIETPPEKPSRLDRILGAEKVREYERYQERKELGLE